MMIPKFPQGNFLVILSERFPAVYTEYLTLQICITKVFVYDSTLAYTMHIQTMVMSKRLLNDSSGDCDSCLGLRALIRTFHQLHEWTLSAPHVIYVHS